MIIKRIKKKSGFTLVELLISITIFSLLLITFLALFMSAFSLTIRAGDRDSTLAGISGKVEKTMADPGFADSADDDGDEVAVTDDSVTITFTNPSVPPEDIDVTITTGTGHMKDGTEVIIKSYETAETPPAP